MTIYKTFDGLKINTKNAKASWEGSKRPITERMERGSQYPYMETPRDPRVTEKLHCSRNGLYYIEYTTTFDHIDDWVKIVKRRAAVIWLLENGFEMPEDLRELAKNMDVSWRYERIDR